MSTEPRRKTTRTATMLAMVLGTALSAASAPAADTLNGITRYCTASWRNARLPADVWPDCTQEVFVRLLERLPADVWDDALKPDGDEHRELLRAIDCVKKRVQRAKKTQAYPEIGVVDLNVADSNLADTEEIALAFDEALTPRQQRILQLWAEGHEVPAIAQQLGTTAPRVSDDKYKAIKRLREHFAGREV
jgi:DNA-binding CsgD family transcriptional regulator